MLEEESEEEMEQNISAGYCIKVYVYPNGYSVGDLEPLTEDESAPGELVESPSDMLKQILAVIKSNPVEPGEQEGFAESMNEPQGKPQEY